MRIELIEYYIKFSSTTKLTYKVTKIGVDQRQSVECRQAIPRIDVSKSDQNSIINTILTHIYPADNCHLCRHT